MRQSIEDGVTLQIIYEGRTHKAEVPDQAALDAAFEDVFSEYDLQEHLKACSDPSKHETSTKSFKLPFGGEDEGVSGDVGILIVNNVLLTGFDAPVERVMYLDKVVVAHNLLQAIARVNRVAGESKDKGFVVDYVGIGHHLKQAIGAYDEREQKEVLDTLSFPEDELRELEANFKAIMDLLHTNGLDDLSDHDAIFDVFYDEDLRFEFISAFKKLTPCLNLVFPAKQASRLHAGLSGPCRDQRTGRQAPSRRAAQHEGDPTEAAGHHRHAPGILGRRRRSEAHRDPRREFRQGSGPAKPREDEGGGD